MPPAREPTNEARAETKLVWAMPCKEEEDRRSKSRKGGKLLSHADIAEIRRKFSLSKAGGLLRNPLALCFIIGLIKASF